MEENIKVYVKVDSNNVIIDILSNIESLITGISIEGWIQIDEGQGDKYAHAQGNYFPRDKGIRDIEGRFNYKLIEGKVVELTEEEKDSLFPDPTPQPTKEELLQKQLLETQAILANLQEQILLKSNGGM